MINWGIVGCGDVCEVKSGPAFYKIEGSSLVAVMRRDAEKAADFAKRHHVAKSYSTIDDLLADPQVNAVYIATPPHLHKQYTIQALQSGRPVYVEKPMAMDTAECEEMRQVSQQTGQPLFVAYYSRSLPYFTKVKELIDSGAIGKPVTVHLNQFFAPSSTDMSAETHTWRIKPEMAGGGYFYDLAPHALDILDFLLGKIVEVKGIATNLCGFYEAEDTVSAAFQFESGTLGTAIWSFVTEKKCNSNSIEISGTKGRITFSLFDFTPIVLTTHSGKKKFRPKLPKHVQQPLIETIVAELNGKKDACPSTADSAIRTAWVMDKIIGKI